eukprot:8661192-Alexandrium_andersonii.AAC.1
MTSSRLAQRCGAAGLQVRHPPHRRHGGREVSTGTSTLRRGRSLQGRFLVGSRRCENVGCQGRQWWAIVAWWLWQRGSVAQVRGDVVVAGGHFVGWGVVGACPEVFLEWIDGVWPRAGLIASGCRS